jgi:hypothetical protein
MEHRVNLLVALGRSAGTLPTPWNAGIVGMGWVTEDFAESEVKQGQRVVVLNLQKVPFQGFWEITAPLGRLPGYPLVSSASLSRQFFATLR